MGLCWNAPARLYCIRYRSGPAQHQRPWRLGEKMADEPQKTLGNPIPTEGFPIVYANLASLTANYNDLRIYFVCFTNIAAVRELSFQPE